jgi:plastocyanin
MKYLLLVLVVCSVGILMIPNAFAVNERTVTVHNAPGSSVPGCEETNGCFVSNRVTIRPGDTVLWTNPDTMIHFVTSGTVSDGPDGGFDSGIIMQNRTFSYQFTKSGLYNYFCSAHPWMEGVVIVKEGPDWTPPPSVPTSKTSSKLTLDPLPTTFNVKGSDSGADVTFSGKLETVDRKFIIHDAKITLKFTGFTFNGEDHYETTTDDNGKFNKKFTMPIGNDYGIQAVFEGTDIGTEVLAPSKSQIEYFIVTSSSSSQPTSSVGGPTFLKLEVETDKRDVTVSGKLTDKATKRFVVRDTVITLIPSNFEFSAQYNMPPCKVSGFPNCKLTTDRLGNFDVDFQFTEASIGEKFSIQAVFHGNNQWDPSKSLTQSFTVTSSSSSSSSSTSSSQPKTSTSSGDMGWIWLVIIGGVVCAVVVVVLAKRSNGKKKTPTTTPQRRTFGVKQPKKRRTGSPASVPPSGESASTFAHYECPDCHSDNIIQYQDGAESCSDCGWKS